MSYEMRRFINDIEVREGAEITEIAMTEPVLGRRLKAGAICESLHPEAWRGIITTNGRQVWIAAETSASYETAHREAGDHIAERLDAAVRDLFA